MKKKVFLSTVVFFIGMAVFASSFGSAGALDAKEMDLEAMLKYALEDEHMALAEYEALMKEFDLDRPYSNIARSERTHISYLEELYETHGISMPKVNAEEHLVLPSSPQEAAEIGVQAEVNNIAMYEQFLEKDLPADVREVFEDLKKGSENHLRAFQRQLDKPSASGDRGRDGRGREGRGRSAS